MRPQSIPLETLSIMVQSGASKAKVLELLDEQIEVRQQEINVIKEVKKIQAQTFIRED